MSKDETFDEMVDRLAGYSLTELVSGKRAWRSIIWAVCSKASRHGYDRAQAALNERESAARTKADFKTDLKTASATDEKPL